MAIRRVLPAVAAVLSLLVAALISAPAGASPAPAGTVHPNAAGTQLGTGTGLYPRLVRLQHSGSANGQLIASVVSFEPGGVGAIYRSTNDGASFSRIGTISDSAASGGFCCTSLYELPVAVGNLAAGTLVWAGSFGQDAGSNRRMSINLWASTDHGVTWAKRSTVVAAPNSGGLWEPEMHVNAEGQLTVYYSDETQSAHSQALMEKFSPDGGLTWGNPYPVVSLAQYSARPGMAVVRELKNGQRIMTYEICGPNYNCDVYFRRSSDGADWSDPALAGARIVASDGTFFRHAPTTTIVDDGSAAGKIVLVGQMYYNNGGVDGGNGITLLTSANGGAGAWTRIVSPVSVPDAYDNYCPNYSSALVPTANNTGVIEIATKYVGSACEPFFATGSV